MIEIPGLVVRERFAQSPLLDVYRCTRSSDNRALVIKVGRDDVTWPAGAQERLLLGSELHAKLKHPNIVPLFHYGVQNGRFYSVEGYISGPDLNEELEAGISLATLTAQLAGIAEGLMAVHEHDVVHGDIKPEHIKIRGNGTPQIVDFGFAVPAQTTYDAWGTPGYQSPEQSAGTPLDGRSDVYSLGVVLYRCLAGRVPSDLSASGNFDRAPRLPDHFALLQPIVDTALAKKPEKRHENARAFAQALQETVKQLGQTAPLPQIRSAPIATRELRELSTGLLTTPLDASRKERRSRKEKQRRSFKRIASLSVLLAAMVGAGYYLERNNIIVVDNILSRIGLVEDPELATAWNQAQSLGGDSNQDLAAIVAAYRRVLSIDSQHVGASEALANLETVWKSNVTTALAQGNIEAAATRLEAAKTAFEEDVEWLSLQTQLSNRERAERIVTSTGLLLTSHGLSDLPSATAAIQSYQEVLRLSPSHPAALVALRELSEHYAELASVAVRQGQLNEGISLLERATAADEAVPLLDEVRKQISQATTARAAIDDLLQSARRYRSENQLMLPAGENAAEFYHRVLAIDPNNIIASQGLIEITSQVAADAEGLLLEGQLAEVDILVNQAQAAGLDEVGVAEIRRRADAIRLREDSIATNLTEANRLMELGYFTAPLGNNAVSKLREVQQIDPGNAEATELLQLCAQRLAAVALEAHEVGLLVEAKQYLDLALAITPEVESWIALREGWEDANS